MSERPGQAPQGYHWKVVVDPTRTGDDPGMFYGGFFRWSDIELPQACNESIPCPFSSGTVFENVKTGERVVIRQGRVVKLEGKDFCVLPLRKEKPHREPPNSIRVAVGE